MLSNPLLQVAAVRKECAALRAQLAAENAHLQEVANAALAENAEQREEIARLRASSSTCPNCEAGRGSVPNGIEALRELERLELALVQEKQHSSRLLDQKRAVEESHTRDVEMLERMLKQVLAENELLRSKVEASKIQDRRAEALWPTDARRSFDATDRLKEKEADFRGHNQPEFIDEPEMEPRRVSYLGIGDLTYPEKV
eukprot:CAMPEP_0169077624 /NCGR_PEP_ID=MMETSP1015-20121227/8979_1 /TAXON_ID=342587 /ORGANISM="Karlodinium micrum, Strain CCMP2283" /LENGTH=199 /DNA_ID=CAMNT_0009137163 /DNA_START=52 /DNA_END=651 /DNA_ORIENTATION=-